MPATNSARIRDMLLGLVEKQKLAQMQAQQRDQDFQRQLRRDRENKLIDQQMRRQDSVFNKALESNAAVALQEKKAVTPSQTAERLGGSLDLAQSTSRDKGSTSQQFAAAKRKAAAHNKKRDAAIIASGGDPNSGKPGGFDPGKLPAALRNRAIAEDFLDTRDPAGAEDRARFSAGLAGAGPEFLRNDKRGMDLLLQESAKAGLKRRAKEIEDERTRQRGLSNPNVRPTDRELAIQRYAILTGLSIAESSLVLNKLGSVDPLAQGLYGIDTVVPLHGQEVNQWRKRRQGLLETYGLMDEVKFNWQKLRENPEKVGPGFISLPIVQSTLRLFNSENPYAAAYANYHTMIIGSILKANSGAQVNEFEMALYFAFLPQLSEVDKIEDEEGLSSAMARIDSVMSMIEIQARAGNAQLSIIQDVNREMGISPAENRRLFNELQASEAKQRRLVSEGNFDAAAEESVRFDREVVATFQRKHGSRIRNAWNTYGVGNTDATPEPDPLSAEQQAIQDRVDQLRREADLE